MIRVLVADDQAMVRAGLRLIVEGQADIEVVGEAADGEDAQAAVRRDRPDLVLMDIRMPRLDGIAATYKLIENDPALRILVVTTFDADQYVFEALRAGASGFHPQRFVPRTPGGRRPADRRRGCAPGASTYSPADRSPGPTSGEL